MKTNKRIYLFILAAAVFSVAVNAQVRVGAKASDFALRLSTGQTVKLSSYKESGKAVLLHFWATWCPPCREELPEIDSTAKRLASNDSRLIVLCVCVGDEEKNRAAFMRQNGYTFTGALDADGTVAALYGVSGIPTSVLIGEDGKVQKVHMGRMSAKELADFIKDYEK